MTSLSNALGLSSPIVLGIMMGQLLAWVAVCSWLAVDIIRTRRKYHLTHPSPRAKR